MHLKAAVLSSTLLFLPHYIAAQSLNPIYTFTSQNGDGAGPQCTLLMGPGGVLYGTTDVGGTNQYGTVFQLTPPSTPGAPWTETVLYSFTGQNGDGRNPTAGLIRDSNGVLYGTTSNGGAGPCQLGCGTAFSLTPPSTPGGAWTETVLHEFGVQKGDGFLRLSKLVFGAHGVLYGSTGGQLGPAGTGGTVFSLRPPSSPGGAWTETVLHSFHGNGDGVEPNGVIAINGALYGTTEGGGASNGGTVFELSPPSAGSTAWTETILHNFPGQSPAIFSPNGLLVPGANGALYGTTFEGTVTAAPCYGECGGVFELTPPASPGGAWTETDLYNFTGPHNGDGRTPLALLYERGVLVGTTQFGGPADVGTIFKLAPPSQPGGSWTESVIYSFTGLADGATPSGGVVFGRGDVLFGVTSQAGMGFGTAYEWII